MLQETVESNDFQWVASNSGTKLHLKRHRLASSLSITPANKRPRLSKSSPNGDTLDISSPIQPAGKRPQLSTINAVDLSVSFQPVLASTWDERAFEQQITFDPPIDVTHPNITQPEWLERRSSLQPDTVDDTPNYFDPVPSGNLTSLGNSGEPYFKLLRNGSIHRKYIIVEFPAGYMFNKETKPIKKNTLYKWRCAKLAFGCKARIHTLLKYDDHNVQNEWDLDLTVYVQAGLHTCIPDPSVYYQKKLARETKKIGKREPHRPASSIVIQCMAEEYKEVGLPSQMSRDTFASHINLARVLNDNRRIEKGVLPNKDNLVDFPIIMECLYAQGFVRFDCVTENKQKNGEIVKQRSIFCATDQEIKWLRKAKNCKFDGTFKIVKDPFYQLVSIHSLIDSGHRSESVPVGYIIMSGKSQADYEGVFRKLKTYMEDMEEDCIWDIKTAM